VEYADKNIRTFYLVGDEMRAMSVKLSNFASTLDNKKQRVNQKINSIMQNGITAGAASENGLLLLMQDVVDFQAQTKNQLVEDWKNQIMQQNAASQQTSGHNAWRKGLEADREQIDRIRRNFGLNDRDQVNVILVPFNSRIRPKSFITRPTTSPRAEQLSRQVRSSEARLRNIEAGICAEIKTDQERISIMNMLRQTIRVANRALNRERSRIAALPRSGFIVAKRDES